jgi:hypothetical protein
MKNKPSLLAAQISFIKKFVWKQHRNKLSENDTVLIEQFLLRIKIDSRRQGFTSDQAIEIARPHIAKWAPWYDVESFPWKSGDEITLLSGKALGEAIALTERVWWQCKPKRGGAGITPIDKGTDPQVKKWVQAARDKTAKRLSAKQKTKRAAVRKSLETEVRRLLKEGLSYQDIADKFQAEYKERPSAKGGIIHVWTERQVAGFDPDRDNPDHKRKIDTERKRMKRNSNEAILQDLKKQKDAFEETRRLIYMLHFNGKGCASIARILNKRKRPSRKGGKWHETSVRRELKARTGGTQNVQLSRSVMPRSTMEVERGSKLSQETAVETLQEDGIQRAEGGNIVPFPSKAGREKPTDWLRALEWSDESERFYKSSPAPSFVEAA